MVTDADGSEENMSGMLWEGGFQGALWFFCGQWHDMSLVTQAI